ncbi:autophagy-related protein 18h isoform X2 [Argentina anserina]|uniref:autophagy-related protein 18h isoform X2 n=1 Tax=Argentina anserina TaxID=57926 RepID=UPI0021767BFB|nr:autophagy-related protein 18h isoform X2 [Potentilla anserina]
MKKSLYNGNNSTKVQTNHHQHHHHQGSNRFLPNSLKFISSCIKTASSGVRSASASVAASISADPHDSRDQVLWACFDRVELGPSSFKNVLLLGYVNGFQVLNVEDASDVSELVSKRDDPVTFLQFQPLPRISQGPEGFRSSHPLLMVVACEESKNSGMTQNGRDGFVNGYTEPQASSSAVSPRVVRFYSLTSHSYVHVLRFRSTVYMIRCSPLIVAVGLSSQIYCFDAVTLENKFSVLTYPVPQLGIQGLVGVNIGYGPMAVGPRWLAYAPNNPLLSNTSRLSPQSLTPPGVSPSTSPSSGNLVARYAMESSKQLAAGLLNLGDMGYKTLSKYYQPDGSSSPVASNSVWKVGRVGSHSTETDIAGMVVVKDIVTRAVISQFRAHTSPISALCFDPSGTLLVTASIHGNNINIFRIMPSCSGSGNQSYDLNSSHVHLYKLYRGMTSAVIQDICFSQYSQWIAIVSSRGTCHIFTLSPFGGDTTHKQSSHVDGPSHLPVPSVPWWFTPSFMTNQQLFSPPPPQPVTLSVVSRIKDNSGWISTVSNAASSAAGKASIPSGAVTALFHNSVAHDQQASHLKVTALEYLLVYTPSGHAIQFKLLPRVGIEPGEATSRMVPGSSVQIQDEELRVKVEPLQWWDVCRRTDWPEREECISGIKLGRQDDDEIVMDTFDCDVNDIGDKETVKPLERSHLYLANAEVQINSGRNPIWQKSKIYFYTMSTPGAIEQNFNEDLIGEIEIEKVPVHEVEIRRKNLLPVSDQFHRVQPNWSGRDLIERGCLSSLSDSHGAKEKFLGSVDISGDKLASTGNPDSGGSYPSILQSGNGNHGERRGRSFLASPLLNQSSLKNNNVTVPSKQPVSGVSLVEDCNFSKSLSTLTCGSPTADRTIAKEVESVNSGGASDSSNFFQEGYCKASPLSNFPETTEVVTDVDSSNSPCDREKNEEDGDDGDDVDMLGGVFDFSEEG